MGTGMTVAVPLRVQNLSSFDFDGSINLSYHWYDASGASVVWDGLRTPLAGLRQGEVRAVSVQVAAPATVGAYTLRYDMVREGVAWFSSKGMQLPSRSVAVQVPPYGATYAAQSAVTGQAGTSVTIPVTLTNNGSLAWQGGLFNLAYHLYAPSGAVVVWDGARSNARPGSGAAHSPGRARTRRRGRSSPARSSSSAASTRTTRRSPPSRASSSIRSPVTPACSSSACRDASTTPRSRARAGASRSSAARAGSATAGRSPNASTSIFPTTPAGRTGSP